MLLSNISTDFIRYLHDGEVVDRTYAEVRSDALAVCRRLRRTLPANAHVAIMSRSTYAYIVWLTGLLIGGFVAIPLAPELSPADAGAILRDADAAVLCLPMILIIQIIMSLILRTENTRHS